MKGLKILFGVLLVSLLGLTYYVLQDNVMLPKKNSVAGVSPASGYQQLKIGQKCTEAQLMEVMKGAEYVGKNDIFGMDDYVFKNVKTDSGIAGHVNVVLVNDRIFTLKNAYFFGDGVRMSDYETLAKSFMDRNAEEMAISLRDSDGTVHISLSPSGTSSPAINGYAINGDTTIEYLMLFHDEAEIDGCVGPNTGSDKPLGYYYQIVDMTSLMGD